ncbi:nitrogenase component 1 [Methanolobus sp. ZRKC2]|uniref:nitrogenase component 1 n=1 Tax=Methanolobus sp. ZRKC2 TaxID=3125783 RepID=UPI003252E207
MIQIALYGKGGIGKSTVSANLSAALGERGNRVLQVGCDPKHDSTRLLLGGASIPTVLDYIREKLPEERILEDILFEGYAGVACVEAGGPEPGVGCAGRGILTTFEVLENLGIQEIPFDITIYDVLGDVVCGGFAVPIRREYANAVFLVTSGEYMALYAANNILRGIKNFDEASPRVAGIIHNSRGLEHEDEKVKAFAKAVKLPIVVSIPRSEYFAEAEKQGKTVVSMYPESSPSVLLKQLADHVKKISKGSAQLFSASPLTNSEMEALVLGRTRETGQKHYHLKPDVSAKKADGNSLSSGKRMNFFTKSVKNKQPLQGCSFAGAVSATSQIKDALTIAHGPGSCSHIVSHFLSTTLLNANTRYGTAISEHGEKSLVSTDMDEKAFIFGGGEELNSCLENAASNGWDNIFVVTTCPSGLIGDDIEHTILAVKRKFPDKKIIPVPVDGNLAGDFAQGLVEGSRVVADMIDPDVEKEKGLVNIIGEKTLSDNLNSNFETIKELLGKLDVKVNCRFLANTGIENIKNFKKAELNILAHRELAYNGESGGVMAEMLTSKLGINFFDLPFPIGFRESSQWVELLGETFNRESKARSLILKEKMLYDGEISGLRQFLKGKRVLISAYNPNLDWIIDTILDLGMIIVRVGLVTAVSPIDFRSQHIGILPVEYEYNAEKREKDIETLSPDLVLSNYPPLISREGVHHDAIPFSPDVGFRSGLNLARRWSRLMRLPVVEGWKLDGGDAS